MATIRRTIVKSSRSSSGDVGLGAQMAGEKEGVPGEQVGRDSAETDAYGQPSPIHRERAIAEIAYLLAEKRGFVPGYELDDWLAAEREIDTLMSSGLQDS
jgi:hypothetical protein